VTASKTLRAAATLALGATLAVGSTRAAPGDDAVRAAAAGANPSGTLFRVGLDVGHRLMLSSDRPYRLLDPSSGQPVWKDAYSGEIALLAQGGPEEAPPSVFRIQVGAYATAEAAEQERASLEKSFGVPAVVRYLEDRGSWRVRVGEAKTRAGLGPLLGRLRDAGRKGLWLAEETGEGPPGVTIRLVDAAWDSQATSTRRLMALASPGALLQVQGKTYRGAIEFRVDASGRLRAINWVELEAYLRGVVPSELGPEVWPQLEALKAQAVAARTYAVANAAQFDEDGFDICATPRCQAYGGASAEHPLSDRAVAETRGEIATWQGRPIDALYTATCGGHTEDAKEIFPEQAAPYLVGVPCRAEAEALARTRRILTGASPIAIVTETGEDVTREAWLLEASGVFGATSPERLVKVLDKPVNAATLRAWTTALARVAGRPAPTAPPVEPSTLAKAALALAQDLGWTERTDVLLTDADLDAVLREPEAAALPASQRRALAYFAQQGIFRPARNGRWSFDRPPSGATIAAALARIGDAYKIFDLDEGTVVSIDGRALSLVRGSGAAASTVAPSARLFTAVGPQTFPVQQLQLWPGDRVRYHVDAKGQIDLLELRPPAKGLSDDRAAAVSSWEVRKTGAELREAVDKRVSVGELRDLRVLRRGASGRIVELEVVGSEGSTVVKGFDVRNLLDLRESLTVIELQRDASGRIASVVFAGKGWGHGVGLCQVGAYGMAVRGADYKKILAHYYSGIAIVRGGSEAPPSAGIP
jgi:stage II sporulation protein D